MNHSSQIRNHYEEESWTSDGEHYQLLGVCKMNLPETANSCKIMFVQREFSECGFSQLGHQSYNL